MGKGLSLAIATWGYIGYTPAAPGTAASVAALAIAWAGVHLAGLPVWSFAAAAVLLSPLAVWASGAVAGQLGAEDPSIVVIDEVLGLWLALAPATSGSPQQWLCALVLFRLFDILKPLGLRRLESLPGGRGIVADDLGAGAYAMIGVALVRWIGP
ncbi:MAG: phosphatidylglycerophosphatase A [Bryobacterales bacterium]|nr:phosphatidylglycerophosphatase A [Bryobacterales bacterium]